jgi:hypothetical protein
MYAAYCTGDSVTQQKKLGIRKNKNISAKVQRGG